MGYEKWVKSFNLKEAAKTLIYLEEHGLNDYEILSAKVEEASQRFDMLSGKIKASEKRFSEISSLQKTSAFIAKPVTSICSIGSRDTAKSFLRHMNLTSHYTRRQRKNLINWDWRNCRL